MNDRMQLEQSIIQQAAVDPEFRGRLITEPKLVISSMIGQDLPEELNIKVLEETTTEKFLVLPENEHAGGVRALFDATAKRIVSVIAYAKNENSSGNDVVDRQTVNIPDDWVYDSDDWHLTTANPQDEGEGRWHRSKGVTRNGNRVTSVWVEARAGTKDTYGSGIWVGVQLDVGMVPK